MVETVTLIVSKRVASQAATTPWVFVGPFWRAVPPGQNVDAVYTLKPHGIRTAHMFATLG